MYRSHVDKLRGSNCSHIQAKICTAKFTGSNAMSLEIVSILLLVKLVQSYRVSNFVQNCSFSRAVGFYMTDYRWSLTCGGMQYFFLLE